MPLAYRRASVMREMILIEDASFELPRSKVRMDRETFSKILDLTRAQPWLELKQVELLDMLDICEDLAEQSLLCDLVSRFHYVNTKSLAEAMISLKSAIVDVWGLKSESTVIAALNKGKYADSSQMLLWYLKPVLGGDGSWEMTKFVNNLTDAIIDAPEGGCIVLVDEFAGTGETISKVIKWVKNKAEEHKKSVSIYVCLISAMNGSKEKLDESGTEYHVVHWLKRGITDFYEGIFLEKAIDSMNNLESRLDEKFGSLDLKKYKFGYKKSEGIYYFENGNVPNNVFPIFWWPRLKNGSGRRPLLRRA